MLDIKFVKNNFDLVKKAIKDKEIDLELDHLLNIQEKRSSLLSQIEEFRAQKNEANKEIIKLDGNQKKEFINKMKEVDRKVKELEKELENIEIEYQEMMWKLPLPPYPEAIIGGEESNKVLYKKGNIPEFEFEIKDHISLGKDLDIIDFEQGVKTMGSRGYFLKNEASMLETSLFNYALNFLTEKGFNQMSIPIMAFEKFFYGTGHLPFGGDEIFKANDKHRDYGLIGTAEISLCAYFADKILKEEDLPIKVMALSPCFRTEVGSYGKDTKGLYRVKQFYKVEQFIICKNDVQETLKHFDELLNNAEEFLQSLELPYHVLELATGDMGAGKYKMYDIETYMPSREQYGETHSCSCLLDWQSRRSNIKYQTKEGTKEFVHTLNNTIVASPRILIPLLELNQQQDGTILIPNVLQTYTGFDVIGNKK